MFRVINSPIIKMGELMKVMHGHTNIKFIKAKQAKGIHLYKNIKRKLYRTNAAVWYNKTCRDKQLTPNYISIKK